MLDRDKSVLYSGNIYWLYEALKTTTTDFDFEKPYKDDPEKNDTEMLFYECVKFCDEREDSLFVMQDGVLYEYFAENKFTLILKLIQYYQNRLENNISSNYIDTNNAPITVKKSNFTGLIREKFHFDKLEDPEKTFKTIIRGNIHLTYKNGTTKWVYDYELKKLMFYFDFLPNSKNIKLIRIFPLSVKELDTFEMNYEDKDDQFVETKEAMIQKALKEQKTESKLLNNFIGKCKTVFYDNYALNLKKIDLILFKFDEKSYILNIKNLILEKYEKNHVQLDSEGLYFRYVDKYKEKTKLVKNKDLIGDFREFYESMYNKYDQLFHHVVSDDYLNHPKKDPRSDIAYSVIKPGSPYKLSELMSNATDYKTFVEFATNNLWVEDPNGA